MNIEILQNSNDMLLKRKDVRFKITQAGPTPSRVEVKGKLAALLNTNEKLIVINKLKCSFGKQETIGYANIYENEERLKQIAREYMVKRDAVKAKPEGTDAQAGAPPQAAAAVPEKGGDAKAA